MEVRSDNIMRDEVRHLGPNDTVAAAAQLMRDACVGFLPICDADDRVVGVLTDRDVCVRMVAEGRDPETTTIDRMMTTELVCCSPSDALSTAADLMERHHICRVLVTDERGKLCGVISLADLAHTAEPLSVARVARRVFERELRVRRSDRPGPPSSRT